MTRNLASCDYGGNKQAVPPRKRLSVSLLCTLTLLNTVAPFATNLLLPAFPEIVVDLGATAVEVQLTMTSLRLGIGLGQLVFGPISDRFGRRRPLLIGAMLCAITGPVAAFAPNLQVLVGARFIQGLSGAAGIVIGRAVISDLARGREAVRAFNLLVGASATAPVVAPLIGSALVSVVRWRGVLLALSAFTLVMVVAVFLVVKESRPPTPGHLTSVREQRRNLGRLLRSRSFCGYALVYAFAFAGLMVYSSASPFFYQEVLGLRPSAYGVVFGLGSGLVVVLGILSVLLTKRLATTTVLGLGVSLLVASAVAATAMTSTRVPDAWMAVPLLLGSSSVGLIFGNATALALAGIGKSAGTASAAMGTTQYAIGASIIPLAGMVSTTPTPMVWSMLAAALLCLVAYLLAVTAGS